MIPWLWLACTRGTITTTDLPEGRVGELYTAAIEGDVRRSWIYSAEGLPPGITINPSTGVISGVPEVRGDSEITVRLESRRGNVRVERPLLLPVRGPRPACGRILEGDFSESAFEGFAFDWERDDGWEVIRLPVPGPEVEELHFEAELDFLVELYVLRPGVARIDRELPIGAQALRVPALRGRPTLGWDAEPHLGAYQAIQDELVLVVAGNVPTEWSLATVCATAPVVRDRGLGPFRVDERARGSFRATKYDEEVVVEALDPLPAGLELTETGAVLGTPTEPGLTAVRLRMTREPLGTTSVTTVGIGIYEPVQPACGETVAVMRAQLPFFGLDSQDLPFAIDPDRFAVVEVPWEDHVGLRIDVEPEVEGNDPALQLLERDVTTFEAGLDFVGERSVEVSPQSWPPASAYRGLQPLRLVVSGLEPLQADVTVTCEDAPLPTTAALPLLEPGGPARLPLTAVGGTPPLTWSATELPAGVEIEPNGTLAYDGADFGFAEPLVTVEDAEGRSSVSRLPLWTLDEACDVVLDCGQTVSIFASAVACVHPAAVAEADWVAYDVAHDGLGAPSVFRPGEYDLSETAFQYSRYQGGLGASRLDAGSVFDLDLYDGHTWPLGILDSAASPWTVCAQCGTGPQPPNDEITCD